MEKRFLVIVMVIIALMACKIGSELDPKCEITNHAIDDDLSCGHAAIIYGFVNGIPIYRTKAVSDAQMAGVVAKVQAGYDGVSIGFKPNINTTKVSAIWIIDGVNGDCVPDGTKHIIKLGQTFTSGDMTTWLEAFAGSELVMLKSGKLPFGKNLENIKDVFSVKQLWLATEGSNARNIAKFG